MHHILLLGHLERQSWKGHIKKTSISRSELQNQWKSTKNKKKLCIKLYKKEWRRYFESLDPSNIVDSKTLRENVQLLSSEKRKISNKFTLVDKEDKIISEDSPVSEEINSFFQNSTQNLNINENSYIKDETNEYTDTVEKSIYKYVNHPSILLIKNNLEALLSFV